MRQLGERAVVLGASMAGLLAARVLADFYQAVTVVERDVLPTDPVNRRGVPQGRMIHAVQTRGLQIMDELFAGLAHELEAGGAATWDGRDFSKFRVSVGAIASGSSLVCRTRSRCQSLSRAGGFSNGVCGTGCGPYLT
jgi:2-polyprenyl-6-methoxyphenol hydroxylase-like FAD-dependent oxidoreductase